jgi:hypothetical protein
MKGAAALVMAILAASPMAQITGGESASVVLATWCATHHPGERLKAEREQALIKPASATVRRALHVRPGEALAYRRVRLACGAEVLSEADNWYVPARLTPEMNRVLETTDTPFGLVVRPLAFTRVTLSVRGREVRALLRKPGGAPFSYVIEDYAAEIAP